MKKVKKNTHSVRVMLTESERLLMLELMRGFGLPEEYERLRWKIYDTLPKDVTFKASDDFAKDTTRGPYWKHPNRID